MLGGHRRAAEAGQVERHHAVIAGQHRELLEEVRPAARTARARTPAAGRSAPPAGAELDRVDDLRRPPSASAGARASRRPATASARPARRPPPPRPGSGPIAGSSRRSSQRQNLAASRRSAPRHVAAAKVLRMAVAGPRSPARRRLAGRRSSCSRRTSAGATAPRARGRAYRADLAELARWADAQGLAPRDIGPREVRRYVAHLSRARLRARAPRRASWPRPGRCSTSLREHGHIAAEPRPSSSRPRGARATCRACSARARPAVCSTRSRPASPLELRDRAMFELAYSCGLRAEELVSLRPTATSTSTPSSCGSRARVARPAWCPSASRRRPPLTGLPGARPRARSPRPRAGPQAPSAMFLSVRGRRLGTSDVRRRLRLWAARAGIGDGLLAPRPAPQLRHPPARRRRRPAQHPGDARPRERLEHPDLHSRGVRQAEERLRAQPPPGLNRRPSPGADR